MVSNVVVEMSDEVTVVIVPRDEDLTLLTFDMVPVDMLEVSSRVEALLEEALLPSPEVKVYCVIVGVVVRLLFESTLK